jgi:membrane protein DedA with SNARE-associated domain
MSGGELDLLLRHGYAVILALVFLEHIGLPIPGAPILLAAGALAGTGQLDFATALLAALLGCGLSDAFWFEVGRRRGIDVLRLLCRLSPERDSCVRRTEGTFARRGPSALLIAKFLPGLNSVAAPMGGMSGMSRLRFHALAGAGALLWAASWMSVGWIFRHQLDRVMPALRSMGFRFGLGLSLVGLVWIGWLLYKRDHRRGVLLRPLMAAGMNPRKLWRDLARLTAATSTSR